MVIRETFEKNHGILRLIPVFVPRSFNRPGRRLKLHPNDYYALGTARGAIKERWLSSVVTCSNGPLAASDEGLSYVETEVDPVTLKDFVEYLGAEIVGQELMNKYGNWPMYSKFFDYNEPLFFHLHLDFEAAARIGCLSKPEAYYYPPQLNNHPGTFPHTYFGLDPDVTKEMVAECLQDYENRDIRITELSRAYRIELGTGWYTPPGVLHAPGSYLTYEPQWNSDVYSVFENIVAGEAYPYEFLANNCPEDKKQDMEYILSLLDWEKNLDPHYKKTYFRPPIISSQDETHVEKWITYANDYFAAKELTVYPGQTVTIKDPAAYGCIFVQGHGKFGTYDAETPAMIRFGQNTADEYFVSEKTAREGVTISNPSMYDPIVILKHFANNHPNSPKEVT